MFEIVHVEKQMIRMKVFAVKVLSKKQTVRIQI